MNISRARFNLAGCFRVGVCLLFMLGGCTYAQTVDVSTDEAVLSEMQKHVDAKRESEGQKGGSKLTAKSVCIERLEESPKVIVIGFFRYDQGCHFEGAFVDSHYLEKSDPAFSKRALNALGWETAKPDQREGLAELWVEKGLAAFFTVLHKRDEKFQGSTFQPPQATTEDNGDIVVKLWVRVPGNRGKMTEKLIEYRFGNDGNLKL
jgi:hypothetical protein